MVLTAIAATTLMPVAALAQADFSNQGYLVDGSQSVVKSGLSGCWHTSEWTPARATYDSIVVTGSKPITSGAM
jgi:hypothetical protein